jgi:PST family polysaccharide transporter
VNQTESGVLNTSTKSYRRIFLSTAVIGGASAVDIVFRMVRAKYIALTLGAESTGLIAITSLRVLTLILAAVGFSVVVISRNWIAKAVFSDSSMAFSIGCLGFGVAFSVLASSGMAVVQGFRRISDLAWIQIISGAAAALLAVVLVVGWESDGLVWLAVLVPGVNLILAIVFVKRIRWSRSKWSISVGIERGKHLLTLGVSMMAAGLAMMGVQFVIRARILRTLSLDDLGYFQAAWAIAGMYLGFVLSAMARDYYPRLSAIAHDRERATQLINEQMKAALHLAGPLLAGVLVLSGLVLTILYTPAFTAAVPALRWMILGNVLKVISWPMGFVILAQGRGGLFLLFEVFFAAMFLVFSWLGIKLWGVTGVGVAFFTMSVVHTFSVFLVARKLTDYRFDRSALRLALALLTTCLSIFALSHQSETAATAIGIVVTGILSIGAWRQITSMTGENPLALVLAAVRRKVE